MQSPIRTDLSPTDLGQTESSNLNGNFTFDSQRHLDTIGFASQDRRGHLGSVVMFEEDDFFASHSWLFLGLGPTPSRFEVSFSIDLS